MSIYQTFEERTVALADTIVAEIYDELKDKNIIAEVTATRHGITVVPIWAEDGSDENVVRMLALQTARANAAYYLKEHTVGHYGGQEMWAHIVGRPVSDYKIEVQISPVTYVTEEEDCGCNH